MIEMHEENPDNVKHAEIIVGIPSYNEADLIGFPTKQANDGLIQFYPDRSSVIINCDNCSTDGTQDAFMGVHTEVPKIYLSTPEGIKGKGNNFKNLFRKAIDLKAKAIVVVDADLKSITPRWIKNLGDPLFRNFGFVAPLYVRHRFDGTITNNIAYPLTRALYGRRVRQPIGGDFGFSGQLAQLYVESGIWEEAIAQFGIDVWMTTLAVNHKTQICQTFMGRPKVHKPKDPSADLGPMFNQVVGTAFSLMTYYKDSWSRVKWSKPTAIFGFGLGETEMPPDMTVNKEGLYVKFNAGAQSMTDQWDSVLTPEVFAKLVEVAEADIDRFDFPTELWAKILFDYAIAYKCREDGSNTLLDSLQPLYYGRVLSYVNKVDNMSTQQAEEYVEDQCLVFEETKPYLVERWNSH
jgi:glycosyltransferase involved in cell wall biosynthesis